MAKAVGSLGVEIFGTSKKLDSAFGQATKRMGEFSKSVRKMGKYMAVGTAALGAGFAAAIYKTTQAAAAQEEIMRKLEASLNTINVSYGDVKTNLDDMFSSLQKTTKYGDTDTAMVLQRLIAITGNYDTAVAGVSSTLDFASAMSIDYNTAARLVGQAVSGNTGTLSRYGIVLDDATRKMLKNADQAGRANIIYGLLQEKFGGAAQAELGTYAGKVQQLKNYFSDFVEAIGDKFLPIFGSMAETLTGFFQIVLTGMEKVKSGTITQAEAINTTMSSIVDVMGSGLKLIFNVFNEFFYQVLAPQLVYYGQLLGVKFMGKFSEVVIEGMGKLIQHIAKAWLPILGPKIIGAATEKHMKDIQDMAAAWETSLAKPDVDWSGFWTSTQGIFGDFKREVANVTNDLKAKFGIAGTESTSNLETGIKEGTPPVVEAVAAMSKQAVDEFNKAGEEFKRAMKARMSFLTETWGGRDIGGTFAVFGTKEEIDAYMAEIQETFKGHADIINTFWEAALARKKQINDATWNAEQKLQNDQFALLQSYLDKTIETNNLLGLDTEALENIKYRLALETQIKRMKLIAQAMKAEGKATDAIEQQIQALIDRLNAEGGFVVNVKVEVDEAQTAIAGVDWDAFGIQFGNSMNTVFDGYMRSGFQGAVSSAFGEGGALGQMFGKGSPLGNLFGGEGAGGLSNMLGGLFGGDGGGLAGTIGSAMSGALGGVEEGTDGIIQGVAGVISNLGPMGAIAGSVLSIGSSIVSAIFGEKATTDRTNRLIGEMRDKFHAAMGEYASGNREMYDNFIRTMAYHSTRQDAASQEATSRMMETFSGAWDAALQKMGEGDKGEIEFLVQMIQDSLARAASGEEVISADLKAFYEQMLAEYGRLTGTAEGTIGGISTENKGYLDNLHTEKGKFFTNINTEVSKNAGVTRDALDSIAKTTTGSLQKLGKDGFTKDFKTFLNQMSASHDELTDMMTDNMGSATDAMTQNYEKSIKSRDATFNVTYKQLMDMQNKNMKSSNKALQDFMSNVNAGLDQTLEGMMSVTDEAIAVMRVIKGEVFRVSGAQVDKAEDFYGALKKWLEGLSGKKVGFQHGGVPSFTGMHHLEEGELVVSHSGIVNLAHMLSDSINVHIPSGAGGTGTGTGGGKTYIDNSITSTVHVEGDVTSGGDALRRITGAIVETHQTHRPRNIDTTGDMHISGFTENDYDEDET